MCSVLVDNGQLQLLHLMLNDLKTKVGYVTTYHRLLQYAYIGPYRNLKPENCKDGIQPPTFGRGSMLKLPERTGTEELDRLTKFKLFECGNVIEPSSLIPKAHNQATSCIHKTLHANDPANKNDTDCSTDNTVNQLSPLLANSALSRAVSQVQLPIDGWKMLHIFKLFIVLVDPPLDLDISAIEGLYGCLTKLQVEMRALVQNGIHETVCHCWGVLLSTCSIHDLCTFCFHIFTVDSSTVLQWTQPSGAVSGPDPTHSAVAVSTAARAGYAHVHILTKYNFLEWQVGIGAYLRPGKNPARTSKAAFNRFTGGPNAIHSDFLPCQ